MSGVSKIHARQIFDSRGNPTVEVDLVTPKGTIILYLLCGYYIIAYFFNFKYNYQYCRLFSKGGMLQIFRKIFFP